MPLVVAIAPNNRLVASIDRRGAVYTKRTVTSIIAALATVLNVVAQRAINAAALDVEADAAMSRRELSLFSVYSKSLTAYMYLLDASLSQVTSGPSTLSGGPLAQTAPLGTAMSTHQWAHFSYIEHSPRTLHCVTWRASQWYLHIRVSYEVFVQVA
jgi:hypothetical protein